MEEWGFILKRLFNCRDWHHEFEDLSYTLNLGTHPDFRRNRSKRGDRKDAEVHLRERLRDSMWGLLYRRRWLQLRK
jgi:hypothetical protein